MSERTQAKRRIKLIKPGLQLRLIGVFLGVSALGFLMQTLIVWLRLAEAAELLPESAGNALMAMLPRLPLEVLLASFGMLLPFTFAIGVLATFRVAGPVYRFEQYLKEVINGTQIGPCKLRKGDDLQQLCELINQATEPLRQGQLPESAHREEEAQLLG